jgi:hypothetical protein
VGFLKNNPILCQDSTPAVVMTRIPLLYNTFSADQLVKGPIPVLFTERPEEAIQKWKQTPQFAFRCLQALATRLLATQNITR